MAVTPTPIHIQAPKNASVQLTATGNTNVDGTTGTYTTVMTAGTNGSKIERIVIVSVGTTVADKVRLFIGGKLWREILFAAATPSNTVTNLTAEIDCSQAASALILAPSVIIIANVNTGTSSLFNVHVFYGDY